MTTLLIIIIKCRTFLLVVLISSLSSLYINFSMHQFIQGDEKMDERETSGEKLLANLKTNPRRYVYVDGLVLAMYLILLLHL